MSTIQEHQYTLYFQTNFDLIKRLGKGGFGVVCHARNKLDGRDYAIKRINYPQSEKRQAKVLREVESLARLDHPNIVGYCTAWFEPCQFSGMDSIWENSSDEENGEENGKSSSTSEDSEFSRQNRRYEGEKTESTALVCFLSETNKRKMTEDEQNDIVTCQMKTKRSKSSEESSSKSDTGVNPPKMFLFIQMELCEDDNLQNWLERNDFRVKEEVVSIFYQVLEAVSYIHKKNVIHRDIKPSNIFFCMNGHVKVGDFGLARPLLSPQELIDGQSQEYSPGVGTAMYMSPEQLALKPYKEGVDIYALGIIWFELLVPFKTLFERFTILKGVKEENFPIDFCANFPAEHTILTKMLSKIPEDRPSAESLTYLCQNMYASYISVMESNNLF